MNIGVVGNRIGWNYNSIKSFLKNKINKNDTIISGGAIGVDSFAQQFAKEMGIKILIIYPDPNVPSPNKYYNRNQKIVNHSEKLIAFQIASKKSGTQSTINRARKRGLDIEIISKFEEE